MAQHEVAISVKDIHKEFILPQSKNTSFKQAAVNIVRNNNKVTQKVLDGVSFDIHKGDFFGIVGRNGSGKSTLLKLIAGVYTPSSGDIWINGGVTPFIELGVGFNHELSGRDNVYLNGALLGCTRDQVDEMYDDIVEFAELGPFMDQKLKNYSSGMQVRLAFSIAIKAKNDTLIFDEVLAVGDEAFQRKCIDVFEEYKAKKQTVVLVTHDMETVKKFCNKAVLLQDGKVIEQGDPLRVADRYSRLNQDAIDKEDKQKNLKENAGIKTTILDSNGKPRVSFKVNETISFQVEWADKSSEVVLVDLFKKNGELISNFITKRENLARLPKNQKVTLDVEAILAPGGYRVDVSLWDYEMTKMKSIVYEAVTFSVVDDFSLAKHSFGGITLIPRVWRQ